MLTVPQAARRVGRNPETIRRWIRAGRLASRKVGTQHLIDEQDLQAAAAGDARTLPESLRQTADGAPQPDWASILADIRSRPRGA